MDDLYFYCYSKYFFKNKFRVGSLYLYKKRVQQLMYFCLTMLYIKYITIFIVTRIHRCIDSKKN